MVQRRQGFNVASTQIPPEPKEEHLPKWIWCIFFGIIGWMVINVFLLQPYRAKLRALEYNQQELAKQQDRDRNRTYTVEIRQYPF